MRHDPHTLIEGCLIASFAMNAHACYIYIRGEYIREKEALQAAIDEAYDAGLRGPNAARLRLGFRPLPASRRRGLYLRRRNRAAGKPRRQKGDAAHEAAVPGGRGLYGCPTTVNNVESLPSCPPSCAAGRNGSRLRPAQQRGNQAVCRLGPREQPVRRRRGDVDPVRRADRDPLRRHSRRLGQPEGGDPRRIVGALPACAARHMRDAIMDFDWLREQGSGLGTAAVIVMDKSDRHHQGDLAAVQVLQARKLRPVHAVPRRHRLDDARDGPSGDRRGRAGRDRHAASM